MGTEALAPAGQTIAEISIKAVIGGLILIVLLLAINISASNNRKIKMVVNVLLIATIVLLSSVLFIGAYNNINNFALFYNYLVAA